MEPRKPRSKAVNVVDISATTPGLNLLPSRLGRTRPTYQEHKGTKANLEKVPQDAKEAVGHGLRANNDGRPTPLAPVIAHDELSRFYLLKSSLD